MTPTKAQDQALHALFDQALEESDAETHSPLYADLRGLEERYVDAEEIAVGGMKRILKVLDRQSNRHVAMARLHDNASDLLFDPFIREARLTALLEHPNVISIHDVGVDSDGQPYFTMDLTAGRGLDVVLRKAHGGEGYPLSERLEIFLKVCDAISYAHSRNVIHRDIKPANIQVGQFGEVLVCDWGLGKLIGDPDELAHEDLLNPDLLSEMTLTGEVKGTPGYMAPEQVRGARRDERTDIYALGALLYAILTCRHPIEGNTESMLESTLAGAIVPPAERDPSVPESLSSVVMKAMALKPADRYASANDLVTDLRAFLGGFSPDAHESGLGHEMLLFYRRHRVSCNLAAAFLAIVIAVTALFVDRLEARRAQAEELAARLHDEKQESEALLREVGELASPFRTDIDDAQMLGYGGQISDDFFFQAPIVSHKLSLHSLNEVIRTRPEDRDQASGLIGYLHFMAADLEQAAPLLAMDKRMDGILRVNTQALATWDAEAHTRSAAQLASLMTGVGEGLNRWRLAEKLLAYDYAALGYRSDYHRAVNVLLPAIQLSYDEATQTATITTDAEAPFSLRRTRPSPLHFLPMKKLVFHNADTQDLAGLEHVQTLEVLDLRGSQVTSAGILGELPQLKTLIIRPGQLSAQDRQSLPSHIAIEERDK